jgi:hypothetical protein
MKNTAQAEVVAVRHTFDGARIAFHADGEVSFRTHIERSRLPLADIWRVAENVCLYTAAEIPALLREVKAGWWKPFRVVVRREAPASAVYRAIKIANGGEINIRIR